MYTTMQSYFLEKSTEVQNSGLKIIHVSLGTVGQIVKRTLAANTVFKFIEML